MSRKAGTLTPEQLLLLRRNLTDYFSDDELGALCSELGVDHDRLRGHGRAAKASELVRQFASHGRIPELVAHAYQARPNVAWGDIPASLAAGTASARERSAASVHPALGWVGGLVAILLIAVGLIVVSRGGWGLVQPVTAPSPLPIMPSLAPTAIALMVPTPTPPAAAVTATPLVTAMPTETSAPPSPTTTPTQAPTGTPTPTMFPIVGVTRTLTLLAPINGACSQSSLITFKWTGAMLWPGEAFIVVVAPSEVNVGKCASNYVGGVRYSPPLWGYEWTMDIAAPDPSPPACAGPVEWTVYIRNAAGSLAQNVAAPAQNFEWNPLKCSR